ncbi:MAG: pyruvate formate lyase family protein, partial [Oscillospiraceae bacterium]|nr:pyruvate formate lyase family protein [Oscillospiraceae bacterium]
MKKFEFLPMSERITRMRAKRDIQEVSKHTTINSERTKIYTDYYKAHENEYPILKRSGALKTWCNERQVNVFDDDIFVGTPGPDERSLSPTVELNCRWIENVLAGDDEEFKKVWQSEGSIYMSFEQREIFREAYEYWNCRTLSKMVEGAMTDDYWEAIGNGSILTERSRLKGFSGAPQGHYIANFNKVVNVGFGEVKRQALEKIEEQRGKVFGKDAKKHVFYYSVVRVCDGAMTLSKRYAEACRKKAQGEVGERRQELLRMADSLDWIMENPARTFWEGLQAIILYQLMLSADAQQHGQSIGRVDQYVGDLLKKQLEEGTITMEQAQEYSDAFILRLSDIISMPRLPDNKYIMDLIAKGQSVYSELYNGGTPTAGIALTLGGLKKDGTDACNEATYCLLQTYGRMHFPDPTVALRISSTTPDEIWRLGIESSKISGGIPQLQNDDIIIKSLTDLGLSIEDARDYSIVGCVEPAGTGNEWPACGSCGSESIWNMLDVVLITINGGVNPATGKLAIPVKKLYEYESFEEFKEAFVKVMKCVLDWSISYTNTFEMV